MLSRLLTRAAGSILAGGVLLSGAGVASTPVASAAHPAVAKASATDDALRARLNAAATSRYLGSHVSAQVVDTSTREVVWQRNAATRRMPASTQKTVTALAVLHTIPASTQLITTTRQSNAHPKNVYLKGAGDPTLTSARLTTLAARTAAALKAQGRTTVNVYLDSSAFPNATNAAGWKNSYVPSEVVPVRALSLAGYHRADNDLAAGRAFRTALRANGITVAEMGRGTAPAQTTPLSASWSQPVSSMVAHMLSVSDNTYAEYLLRQAAIANGLWPTWTNALATARKALRENGIPTTGYVNADGSGLSRSNRMPTATLVGTVTKLYTDPAMKKVAYAWGAMPRSGNTGTLRTRYAVASQRCARGDILAKTGTLNDVVSLGGIAHAENGRTYAFAFLVNGPTNTAATRLAVDGAATALVGCR